MEHCRPPQMALPSNCPIYRGEIAVVPNRSNDGGIYRALDGNTDLMSGTYGMNNQFRQCQRDAWPDDTVCVDLGISFPSHGQSASFLGMIDVINGHNAVVNLRCVAGVTNPPQNCSRYARPVHFLNQW